MRRRIEKSSVLCMCISAWNVTLDVIAIVNPFGNSKPYLKPSFVMDAERRFDFAHTHVPWGLYCYCSTGQLYHVLQRQRAC